MKKFFVFLCAFFICTITFAHTMNWYVGDSVYDTTTCETGTNLTVPNPAPTKYGYHFVGWHFDEIIGTGSQSGTPTPTNPIEPTFKPLGNTVLRAVGTGANVVADSYNPITNTITRRVGVKVLNRNYLPANFGGGGVYITLSNMKVSLNGPGFCSHCSSVSFGSNNNYVYWETAYTDSGVTDRDNYALENWFGTQYDAGTPVTFYYELQNPVEEQLP